MSQIRITKTKEIEEVLAFLKNLWPLMDEVEIVKMAISNFFQDQKKQISAAKSDLEIEYLSEEESEGIGISRQQIKKGQAKKYSSQDFLKEVME